MVMSIFSPVKPFPPLPIPDPPDPETVVWEGYTGIYAKIEQNQFDSTTHFPVDPPYLGTGFTRSVYSELQRYTWMRGIQIDLDWGTTESGASGGVYDFSQYTAILDKVQDLADYDAQHGSNKRVLMLITWKTFDITDGTRVLPVHLRTTGTAYAADFPRYDRMIGYVSTTAQAGAAGRGYHYRFADCRNGLDGRIDRHGDDIYTFRTAFLAWFTAAYNAFKDHPSFAGFITIEPSPLASQAADTTTTFNDGVQSKVEFVDADHLAGRLQLLKYMRAIVTNHMIVEAPNHDTNYQKAMTMGSDGCAANHLGFTGPNMHQGTNIPGLYNCRKYLASVGATPGVVPVVVQCQPQDMGDTHGKTPNFWWTWSETAPYYGGKDSNENAPGRPSVTGQPLTQNARIGSDPTDSANWTFADGDWVIIRAFQYLRGNILSYQRNLTANLVSDGQGGFVVGNPFNWDNFVNYMENVTTLISPNTNGSIKDDPDGGAVIIQPDNVV